MRTTVIPAQITTVEDKIAGSLNLTQIMILMIPVFWTTIVYAIFPAPMQLTLYKLPLVFIVLILCLILSLRIKGKVVLNWLAVLFKYNLRPKYYVFNKNDVYLRDICLPEIEKRSIHLFQKAPAKKEIQIKASIFGIKELMSLRAFINNPNYSLSLKPDSKGGLYVALEQIQK
ncbi:MAG: hypothetical protein Q7K55_08450 [Candidatus Levybacteria bacterium]|nr:hypothetical protein [Candidatus Levybacteria bacterium]